MFEQIFKNNFYLITVLAFCLCKNLVTLGQSINWKTVYFVHHHERWVRYIPVFQEDIRKKDAISPFSLTLYIPQARMYHPSVLEMFSAVILSPIEKKKKKKEYVVNSRKSLERPVNVSFILSSNTWELFRWGMLDFRRWHRIWESLCKSCVIWPGGIKRGVCPGLSYSDHCGSQV